MSTKWRLAVAGALNAALVATLTAPAGAASLVPAVPAVTAPVTSAVAATSTTCPTLLGCGDDLAAAVDLERRIDDHLVWDQVVEIDYRTPSRDPGDVVNVHAWGDSGLWTGTYLAAQSFRYATAARYLRTPTLTTDERAFWTAARDEALTRVKAMVAKYHLLVNIAAGWHTELSPSLDPPSFGGGVIDGQRGMLMRACAPVDAAPHEDMPPNDRVFGPFPWTDGRSYMCETAPSRDTYAGTTFGLLAAFDLVGPAVPGMREQIRTDILALARFLLYHGWNYPRPHGNISAPPEGHDFDNFVSPLFVYVPMARLNLMQAARHVTRVVGSDAQRQRWKSLYLAEVATQAPLLAGSMEVDAVQPNEGYYKYNLHHLTGYSLVRLEHDPVLREVYRQALSVMDRTTGDDINAHFETVTFALTGESSRRSDAVTHLRQWRDYRARISLGGSTTNSTKCGSTIECVPEDQLEVVVEGAGDEEQAAAVPGIASDVRAARPLPVADRPPTDFLWQRPPTQLDGVVSATHQAPAIDYLLPYWMLRYYSEVAPPALAPFPPYPGPGHA